MNKKPATIKEIARQLNVSISTVSRALHDHPSIGLRTRMQVQKLARELQYERNQAAVSFKQGKTATIGVILPRFSEEFFSAVISGIEDFAVSNKYNVLIGQSYDEMDREQQIVETMRNSRVDGLLVSVAKNTTSYDHFDRLANYNIPIVFFDCIPNRPVQASVSCNLHQGTVQGVAFLANRKHKHIALLNGPQQLQASHQREQAYMQGLKENDLTVNPALMVRTNLTKEGTQAAIDELLKAKPQPTAIVAFNDYVALEAMHYLRHKKIKINQDISFVSFAHLPLCNYLDNPPLASVEQFPYEQGYKAMEMLYNIITQTDKQNASTQIVLESTLVETNIAEFRD
ncbi:MAG: LacI family DNA-binding transcriptional regulator [Chitinophagaceae bacterium]